MLRRWQPRGPSSVTLWMLTCFIVSEGAAVTRTVPTQYPRIQHAIWASNPGDTVLVLPGTYLENVQIDRAIVVRSAQGPGVTVIDGGAPTNPDSGSVVLMRAGTIEGFAIRNGRGTLHPEAPWRLGGGILAENATSVIRGNWIHGNTLNISGPEGEGYGAGIRANGTTAILSNRVYDNRIIAFRGSGAGLFAGGLPSRIEDNEIFDNHVETETGGSGGVNTNAALRRNIIACNSAQHPLPGVPYVVLQQGAVMESNTVVANWHGETSDRSAVWLWTVTTCDTRMVFGNVIAFNLGYGLSCSFDEPCAQVEMECNDFHGNFSGQTTGDCPNVIGTNNNISVDPLFGQGNCPSTPGDWCLSDGSPLLPENSPPGCGLIGARGACTQVGVADPEGSPASALSSASAAPNPFRERTTISFYLPRESTVDVMIHGILGRRVRTLSATRMGEGEHAIHWDGRTDEGTRAASGAYVATIRAGSEEVTRTLLLVR